MRSMAPWLHEIYVLMQGRVRDKALVLFPRARRLCDARRKFGADFLTSLLRGSLLSKTPNTTVRVRSPERLTEHLE